MSGLAESIEAAIGGRPPQVQGKDQYLADNETQAVELIRHSASQGRLASATIRGQEQPKQSGLEDAITAALNSPTEAPQRQQAQAAPASEAATASGQEDRQRVARMGEHLGPIKGMAETAAEMVSGIGTNIVGGWRGLAELARGGSLKDAVEAVHGQDENALARTYEPQTKEGQVGSQIMSSGYNPINWPGAVIKASAANAVDKTGSPLLGAGIETGGNALLLGLPGLAGKTESLAKIPKPRIKGPAAELVEKPSAAGPAAEVSAAPDFTPPANATSGKALPAAEQQKRIDVLRRVGVENTRRSAVEGDLRASSDDLQQS